MTSITFDTLKFSNRLEKAGLPREQAQAQAEALAEAFEVNLNELVTKADLKTELRELRKDVDLLRKDVDIRLVEMSGKFTLLQWMLGALLAVNIAVMLKLWV